MHGLLCSLCVCVAHIQLTAVGGRLLHIAFICAVRPSLKSTIAHCLSALDIACWCAMQDLLTAHGTLDVFLQQHMQHLDATAAHQGVAHCWHCWQPASANTTFFVLCRAGVVARACRTCMRSFVRLFKPCARREAVLRTCEPSRIQDANTCDAHAPYSRFTGGNFQEQDHVSSKKAGHTQAHVGVVPQAPTFALTRSHMPSLQCLAANLPRELLGCKPHDNRANLLQAIKLKKGEMQRTIEMHYARQIAQLDDSYQQKLTSLSKAQHAEQAEVQHWQSWLTAELGKLSTKTTCRRQTIDQGMIPYCMQSFGMSRIRHYQNAGHDTRHKASRALQQNALFMLCHAALGCCIATVECVVSRSLQCSTAHSVTMDDHSHNRYAMYSTNILARMPTRRRLPRRGRQRRPKTCD